MYVKSGCQASEAPERAAVRPVAAASPSLKSMNMKNSSGQERRAPSPEITVATLPRICMVSSGSEQKDSADSLLLRQIALLPPALPCMVQIREKQLDAAAMFRLCLAARQRTEGTRTLLFLNERADIAAAAGLDGVHLQESSCPPEKLGSLADGLLKGRSVHSLESARQTVKGGVDYLVFGPVFDTPSKRPYGAPQGLGQLRTVCRAVSIPVFAIGGINPDNAASCLEEGAYGIATLSLFTDTRKLPELLETLGQMLRP